jgi:hypothetical protein
MDEVDEASQASAALPTFGPVELEQLLWPNGEVVGRAAAAQDMLGIGGVVHAVFEQTLIDVHADNLAKDHPGADFLAIDAFHLQDLGALAFKADWAFGHAWHADDARRLRCEARYVKFADFGRHSIASLVHCFSQRARDQVPDKLAVGLDVVECVLAADAGKPNQWRYVIECAEKTVGRQIEHATGTAARYPANRAWSHDRVEGVVFQAVAQIGFIEVCHAANLKRLLKRPSRA